MPAPADTMPDVPAPTMPGAEPYSHRGSAHGVLVLHGFTGNPQSLRTLAEAIAAEGYSVELPLLPGHGTSIEDMVSTRWPDWSSAAERAYGALAARCDAVALVALSMGGTLSCALAEQHSEIAGMVLVNPLIEPPAESFRAVLRQLLDEGTEVAPGVGSDIAKPGVVESAYDGSPVAAALSLFEGVDAVAAELGRISCPILLFSSRQDHVVSPSSGDVLVAGVAGPIERVWLEDSYHVATLDNGAEEITSGTVAFLGSVFKGETKLSTGAQ